MKRWIPLAIFLALAGFLFKGLYLDPREVPSPLIDKAAPAFNLPVVGEPGKSFSPTDMKGQVWLLNVWAPWCVSCRQEHPFLMQVKTQGRVPVVGLNWKDKEREAAALLTQVGSPYVAVADDVPGLVGIDYGVTGTPETYLIDQQGIVRFKFVGPLHPQVWQDKIEPKLKELGV